jgi:molecular chaperone DnaK
MSDEQTNDSALILPPPQSVTWRSAALVRRGLEMVSNPLRDPMLMDVTPVSIGFEDENGFMRTVISYGTVIPCEAEADVKVVRGLDGLTLDLFQGIRDRARENPVLATIEFNLGIEENQVTSLSIHIQLSVDSNGIVTISASDITQRNRLSIKVIQSAGLSKYEIEQQLRRKSS